MDKNDQLPVLNAVDQLSDQDIMQHVLALAELGKTTTQPNPKVGCVIIKDGQVVGQGYHHSAGGLHAEREALEQAGDKARGATVYVLSLIHI